MFFDTDCAAVVHNIAYLRFIETARTHLAGQLGMSLPEMARSQQYPVVVRTEIDYKRPAVLGDNLQVDGWLERVERIRFWCGFTITRPADGALLITCRQMLALVQMPAGRPVRLRHVQNAAIRKGQPEAEVSPPGCAAASLMARDAGHSVAAATLDARLPRARTVLKQARLRRPARRVCVDSTFSVISVPNTMIKLPAVFLKEEADAATPAPHPAPRGHPRRRHLGPHASLPRRERLAGGTRNRPRRLPRPAEIQGPSSPPARARCARRWNSKKRSTSRSSAFTATPRSRPPRTAATTIT